jgi:hypothetical protein
MSPHLDVDRGSPTASRHGRPPMRSMLTVAGAVAGVAILLLVLVLRLGGDSTELPDVVSAQEEIDEQDVEASELDELDQALPVVTYEIYLARDPFDPVVPEPEPEPATGGPDAPAPDPGDPDAPAPDPDDPDARASDPDGPAAPPRDGCAGDVEVVCDGHVVTLQEVAEGGQVAVIQVDTALYEVRSGETFAERFRLLSIEQDRVTALFGDERFTLPLGDRVLK